MKLPQSEVACQTSMRTSVYVAQLVMIASNATRSTAMLKTETQKFSVRRVRAKTMSHAVIDRCQTKTTQSCAHNFLEEKISAMLTAMGPTFLEVAWVNTRNLAKNVKRTMMSARSATKTHATA